MKATNGGLKRPHWLLAKSRQWHTWGGVIAAGFLVVAGVSGVILNYKQPVFRALGLERGPVRADPKLTERQAEEPRELTTSTPSSALPVNFDHAMSLARQRWGEVRLERIELKTELGQTVYKVKRQGGEELWIDAYTGGSFVKGQYEKVVKSEAGVGTTRTTDWGKMLLDLHTGKIGGSIGKAVMSSASMGLVFLSLSGVYMWLKPVLIRRQNQQARRAAPPAASSTPAGLSPRTEVVGANRTGTEAVAGCRR